MKIPAQLIQGLRRDFVSRLAFGCDSSDKASRKVKIASLCGFARHAGAKTQSFAVNNASLKRA